MYTSASLRTFPAQCFSSNNPQMQFYIYLKHITMLYSLYFKPEIKRFYNKNSLGFLFQYLPCIPIPDKNSRLRVGSKKQGGEKNRWSIRKNSERFLSVQLTFHQVLLHVSFTFTGLSPCSITKVLTGADYSNKSWSHRGGVTQRTGMQTGLPEVQQ